MSALIACSRENPNIIILAIPSSLTSDAVVAVGRFVLGGTKGALKSTKKEGVFFINIPININYQDHPYVLISSSLQLQHLQINLEDIGKLSD